jgi:Protein of unknown function (DUF1565)
VKATVLSLSALCLALLAPARAGDFYVDVLAGSDGNAGTSPGAAFKTIGKAMSVALGTSDTVHVAPGEYSAATGEVFPLPLTDAFLTGDDGPAVTRVLGTGSETLFEVGPGNTMTLFRIDGLALERGATGVKVESGVAGQCLSLSRMTISGMTGFGLDLAAHPDGSGSQPAVQATMWEVDITGCGGGARVVTSTPDQFSGVFGGQCLIANNQTHGVLLQATAGARLMSSFTQTRLLGHPLAAVRAEASGFMTLGLLSSLVAGNGAGLQVDGTGAELQLDIVYSTLADNSGTAVDVSKGVASTTHISGALFWGNDSDVNTNGPEFVLQSDSEFGDFGTADGNFSADPLFANAAAGDYRLVFGSPCIDAGTTVTLSADIDDAQRPADGNLDAVEFMDVGAHEFNPLVVSTSGQMGTPIEFAFHGSPCMMTSLFFAPGATTVGLKTGFGRLLLDAGNMHLLLLTIVLSPAPNVVSATIPNVPALAGVPFSFQSLTQQWDAPKGAALTNASTLVVIE